MRSAPHDASHCPLEQTLPAGHATPHPPQFEPLLKVSTQPIMHEVSPA
jgi:hypothetical protein